MYLQIVSGSLRIDRLPAALNQVIAAIDIQSGKCLLLTAGPVDDHLVDFVCRTQTEMEPLARLSQITFTGAERFDQLRIADCGLRIVRFFAVFPSPFTLCHDLHAPADSIAVGRFAVAGESHGEEAVTARRIVAQQPQPRPIAVGDPQVQVAIMVPIDDGHSPAIIGKVESAGGRDVGESPSGRGICQRVQETAIPFAAAEGATLDHHRMDLRISLTRLARTLVVLFTLGRRQDLSPKEASQIAGVIGRDKSIGHDQIFPSVVVDVDEV